MVQLTGIWWLNTGLSSLNFNIYKSFQLSPQKLVLLRTKWERLQHLEPTKMGGTTRHWDVILCQLGSPSQVDGPWPFTQPSCSIDCRAAVIFVSALVCNLCQRMQRLPVWQVDMNRIHLSQRWKSWCIPTAWLDCWSLHVSVHPLQLPNPDLTVRQCHWRAPSEVRSFD
jgi:hypothetical protein